MTYALDLIESWLERYIHYTNPYCATAHVLWCAHARLMEHWDISPRLGFFSALPGSGKSNALMLTSYLCGPDGRAGNISVSVSPAAFIRKGGEVEGRQPDLHPQFLDEIDNLYNAASKDGSTDLTTSILNGGYKRGSKYERMTGPNNDRATVFGTFGSVAMAGLGKARLPDSLTDRLIKIPMEPNKPGEEVERFRQRILDSEHKTYRDALVEFCAYADAKIDIERVAIPEGLSGRDIDNWEPLLAVADVAGDDWPARAARCAVWFCTEKAMTKRDSLALRLLKEVVEYLQEVGKAETSQIWQHLTNKSGAPWRDFKFFNESWIRETLYQFPGAPRQGDIRVGQVRVQGFHVNWFDDLVERYMGGSLGPDTPDNIDNENNPVGAVGCESTPRAIGKDSHEEDDRSHTAQFNDGGNPEATGMAGAGDGPPTDEDGHSGPCFGEAERVGSTAPTETGPRKGHGRDTSLAHSPGRESQSGSLTPSDDAPEPGSFEPEDDAFPDMPEFLRRLRAA